MDVETRFEEWKRLHAIRVAEAEVKEAKIAKVAAAMAAVMIERDSKGMEITAQERLLIASYVKREARLMPAITQDTILYLIAKLEERE